MRDALLVGLDVSCCIMVEGTGDDGGLRLSILEKDKRESKVCEIEMKGGDDHKGSIFVLRPLDVGRILKEMPGDCAEISQD